MQHSLHILYVLVFVTAWPSCAVPKSSQQQRPESAERPAAGPRQQEMPGCGRDTDCKGTRICDQGHCVDPQSGIEFHPKPSLALGAPRGNPPGPWVVFGGPAPMFHGDPQHTGRSPFRAPLHTPKERWRFPTQGVVYSSPAIADDGTVVFGSHDHQVYAVGADGARKWKFATGDLVWSSPALGAGGVVYVGSDDDQLYALSLSDGAMRWSVPLGACRRAIGIGPEAVRCDVDHVTLGRDGTIYASADGVYAVRPDGTVRWRFSPGPKVHCASAPAVGPDGVVYAGCQDDGVYAINPDGSKRWEYRGQDDFDSSPVLAPDGTLYIGSDDRRLYALAPDGRPRFAVVTEGAIRSSPALAADGTIYFGSYDGVLYAVHPDGNVAWTFRSADRIQASPLVDAAGVVLFGSEDDRLYALLPDGQLLWSVLLDGDIDSTPVLGPDGTIYVGADDKALHALR